jgi:hypothetical protein
MEVFVSGATTSFTSGRIENLHRTKYDDNTLTDSISAKFDGKVLGGTGGSAVFARASSEAGVRIAGILSLSDVRGRSIRRQSTWR